MSTQYRCLSCGFEWAWHTAGWDRRCPDCGLANWVTAETLAAAKDKRPTAPPPNMGAVLSEIDAALESVVEMGEPDVTFPPVLQDIISYLRRYLRHERGYSEEQVQHFCECLMPLGKQQRSHFRSVPQEIDDEGVKVSIGLLNSIASTQGIQNKEILRLLLSGKDGVRGAKVREGGSKRGPDIREDQARRKKAMQAMVDSMAHKNPERSFREIAEHVAKHFGVHETTIRKNTANPRSSRPRGATS